MEIEAIKLAIFIILFLLLIIQPLEFISLFQLVIYEDLKNNIPTLWTKTKNWGILIVLYK